MSEEQVRVVVQVYNHLLERENRGWDDIDNYLDLLEYLNDDELHREADVVYTGHQNRTVRCQQNHAKESCFIPLLVEASSAILDLYKETNQLHVKNKYILQYYIAMNQSELIVVEP